MATVLSLIPVVLQIAALIGRWLGASADTVQAYEDLVTSTAMSGLISIDVHDKLLSHKAVILARLKANEDKNGKV